MTLYNKTIFLSLILIETVYAEVITDGILGQKINLPGSNFQITSDLGQQHGNNLFHSFQDFNLNSLESATFSGSNSIHNIISRVTGGNPSNIDGLIRSTIPNADFYFLNPHGIMFGPSAKLDVQGSFHASTQPLIIIDPTYNTGDGGTINVEAGEINFSDGGQISTVSAGLGNSGFIKVKTNKLTADGKAFSDFWGQYFHSGISSSSIVADEIGGNAGDIIINADIINLINE